MKKKMKITVVIGFIETIEEGRGKDKILFHLPHGLTPGMAQALLVPPASHAEVKTGGPPRSDP